MYICHAITQQNKKQNIMASIKFGNIVVDARGKINGNVYSKNKGGAYSRVRVIPTNPRSAAQTAVRNFFTTASQAWKALTDTQRNGWVQSVAQFQRLNRLADKISLSGNSLYVSLNKNLADVGIAAISDAPSPQDVASVVVSSTAASTGGQTLTITLSGAVPANTSLKVFCSNAQSPGVASIGTKNRQIISFASAHAAALDLTTAYLAKFGTVGSLGNKIFYSIVPVNEATGQAGGAIRGVITIAA